MWKPFQYQEHVLLSESSIIDHSGVEMPDLIISYKSPTNRHLGIRIALFLVITMKS